MPPKKTIPKKHHKSLPSAFNQKKQTPRFNIIGRKQQLVASTMGKAREMHKRKDTLWNEYWGQKRQSVFVEDSSQQQSNEQHNAQQNHRKRKRDDAPTDDSRHHARRRTNAPTDDSKQSKVARIVARDRELKKENSRVKLETMDEIDQLDEIFAAQRVQFFSQRSVVNNAPREHQKRDADDYDKLVRDLVYDSRVEPARVKQLTQTELEIVREQFQQEEQEAMEEFMNALKKDSSAKDRVLNGAAAQDNNDATMVEAEDDTDNNVVASQSDDSDNDESVDDSSEQHIPKHTALPQARDDSDNDDSEDDSSEQRTTTAAPAQASQDDDGDVFDDSDDDAFAKHVLMHAEKAQAARALMEAEEEADERANAESDAKSDAESSASDEDFDPAHQETEADNSDDDVELMRLEDENAMLKADRASTTAEKVALNGGMSTDNVAEDDEDDMESDDASSTANYETLPPTPHEDSQEELQKAILQNEFIQEYIAEGEERCRKTLLSFRHLSMMPRNIQDLPEKLIELLCYFATTSKTSAMKRLSSAVIEAMTGVAHIAPRKLVTAFKNHLQIMYGKVDPSKGFASRADLLVSKTILSLFSTEYKSGKPHEVTHPLLVYICKNLTECEVLSYKDVVSGLFMCDLCLHYFPGGFLPEVTNFLFNITSTINGGQEFDTVHARIPALRSLHRDWLVVSKEECRAFRKENLSTLSLWDEVFGGDDDVLEDSQESSTAHSSTARSAQWKVSCQLTIASLLNVAISQHKHLSTFKEIYEPLMNVFERLKVNHRPTLRVYRSLVETLTTQMAQCEKDREPLSLKMKPPQEFPSYEPKIYEGIKGRQVGDDEDEVNRKVLNNKVKRMKRQAVRELRRDNEFLRHTRDLDQSRKDHEAKLRYKQALSHLDRERAEPIQYDFSIKEREAKIADIRKQQRKNSRKRR